VSALEVPDGILERLADLVAERVLVRMPEPAERDGFVRVEGAAEFLGLTVPAVRMLIKRGKLPCHRIGSRVLFDLSELREFVRSGRAASL
jgi:excisionase family DNA binding protein